MNKSFLIIIAISILFYGCGTDEQPSQSSKGLYYFTNLDQYYGFVEPYSIFKSNFAYSGDYVSKTDTGSLYSFAFKRIKNDITTNKLLSAQVSCYVYSEQPNADCSLVCAVDTGNLSIIYYATNNLSKELSKSKEWKKVTATFNLNNAIPATSTVRIFLMNQSKTAIYLDDLAVQFTEMK